MEEQATRPATRSVRLLTSLEHDEWFARGAALAVPHVIDFPSLPLPDLKSFVLHYCDGQILCDHHVDEQIIGIVFMPLALGAFHVKGPDEEKGEPADPAWGAYSELPQVGPEPVKSPAPEWQEVHKYDPEPSKPSVIRLDPAIEALLTTVEDANVEVLSTADIFTETPVDDAIYHAHVVEVAAQNAALQAEYTQALAAWERSKDEVDSFNLALESSHQQLMADWERDNADLDARHLVWVRESAIREAAHQGFQSKRLDKLGCIYEHYSKAGPRSINGYPTFFSFHILNKSDWAWAAKAIQKELERRETMEI